NPRRRLLDRCLVPDRHGTRDAVFWTVVWFLTAMAFLGVVFVLYEAAASAALTGGPAIADGREATALFFTGYILEKSLSVDNLFVIAMIFSYFSIPLERQHRLLFWGLLGAIVLRGAMIAAGAALILLFDWVVYIFGALLLVSAYKMLNSDEGRFDPESNWVVRGLRRVMPVSSDNSDGRFFRKESGRIVATPMLLALVLIETTDVLFAIDSVPAVFVVTRDPFLVFTSNIFAILGLRSMYFVLAVMLNKFHHLKISLVFVLALVGGKMLLSHYIWIPQPIMLTVIGLVLAAGVAASLVPVRGKGDQVAPASVDDG
ncbi:MAG: TerC/Alx family metal homeostasis membrane protein, partial [Planctomycetales bacterium]|nr:TerC/Alx family metal homeostasis membrane protein [Planctomycetales bacterium]